MKISKLTIRNFRGISSASLLLSDHALLIGDNNAGKTTVLEAIDLVLGPDRLNRRPPIDEHDFYHGKYLPTAPAKNGSDVEPAAVVQASTGDGASGEPEPLSTAPQIVIEVTVTDLSDEQRSRFGEDYIEWWDKGKCSLFTEANPSGIDADAITSALRVTFIGQYDPDEDDFKGDTYFSRSLTESEKAQPFSKKDKQRCGFLYLRSLRTGSRALSLDHGSLLDIILRLKEVRPQMWEGTIGSLSSFNVASDPALGISGVLESINASLKKYVPREWGVEPHLKVSALTREHLRKVVTAFIATGSGEHAAPFFRQGTGTINMLVLAMLSQIAEDKQNVIFAMEEPETAIPPYAQKRIIHEIRNLSSQSIFTSHSPYVLEEFGLEETAILSRSNSGELGQATISLPESVKHKRYRQEFRTRFCEGLLANRVLIAEGATEAASFPVAARRLAELKPASYSSLEALGICTIDAGTESQIADLSKLYRSLGKKVFGLCDKQSDENQAKITAQVDTLFMHAEKGFENLVLKGTTQNAMKRFADILEWPQFILATYPDPKADIVAALRMYFGWAKGNRGIADFLAQCDEAEIPWWIRQTCTALKHFCDPPVSSNASVDAVGAPAVGGLDAGGG
ncbi:MAG: ATP-dependent endonuclease [Bryobacterales bacterium]|nr:ATP-dependent endonuclease [Bryobacterales bacterium]